MEDKKVKESPSEVFATVADVNSAVHSLEDVVGVRLESVVEKLAAMDINNEKRFQAVDARILAVEARLQAVDARFQAVEEKLAATDINNERRFATLGKEIAELDAKVDGGFSLLEEKIKSLDLKVAHTVTSAANKLLIMMLVIAGSIIASLLYVG